MRAPTPRLLRLLILTSMGVLLMAPMQVAAAPRGTSATLTVTPLVVHLTNGESAPVSTGEPAAFDVVFAEDEKATFTHVMLTGTVTGGSVASVPTGCIASTTTTISCDLGTVKEDRTFRFVFTAAEVPGELSFPASATFDSGTNNQKAASRDTVSSSAAVPIVDRPDYVSRWQAENQPFVESTDPVGPTKPQSAAIEVPGVPFGYNAVFWQHNSEVKCGGQVVGFGQSVELQIANGQRMDPDKFIKLTLTYDALQAAQDDETPLTVGVVHAHVNADGTMTCDFLEPCGATPIPCYEAGDPVGSALLLVVTVYLNRNGVAKGV